MANPPLVTYANQPACFPRVTGTPQILHGDGSPEGTVFASQGSAFMRRDNSGASNALYAKTTGPSLSTGWQAFAGSAAPAPATTLPNSPSNGQQAILVDSTSAPTYSWLFQYQSSASKWIFLGGAPLRNSADATANSAAASGVYSGALGMSVTIPRAGTYDVRFGGQPGGNASGTTTVLGVGLGTTPAAGNEITVTNQGTGGVMIVRRLTGVTASTVIDLYIKDNDSTRRVGFSQRWLEVLPVTVT